MSLLKFLKENKDARKIFGMKYEVYVEALIKRHKY